MLIWAGFVEAFLSQYHEPIIPYEVKIAFGTVELILLTLFLWKSGAKNSPSRIPSSGSDDSALERQVPRNA